MESFIPTLDSKWEEKNAETMVSKAASKNCNGDVLFLFIFSLLQCSSFLIHLNKHCKVLKSKLKAVKNATMSHNSNFAAFSRILH